MQDRSNPQHEVFGLCKPSGLKVDRPIRPGDAVDDVRGGCIPESSRRILDIGFEVIQRVAELGVPLTDQVPKRRESGGLPG